ncbi:uncharacterized protein WCC33_016630 [Rhinophrynus dorsalis]
MMSIERVYLLGLLLCIAVLSTSAQEGSKPGVCPPERYYNSSYPEKCAELCTDDSDCEGDKKCCPDNCYKVCKTPAQTRPGCCPIVQYSGTRCDDECSSDSECPGESKCCMGSCGMFCEPQVEDKPGTCSQEPYLCFVAERDICFSDSSCPGDEKCCPSGCRYTCQIPE